MRIVFKIIVYGQKTLLVIDNFLIFYIFIDKKKSEGAM